MRIYQQLEAWVQPQACATSEGNQIDLNSSVWWGGGRTGYHTAVEVRGKLQGNHSGGRHPISY